MALPPPIPIGFQRCFHHQFFQASSKLSNEVASSQNDRANLQNLQLLEGSDFALGVRVEKPRNSILVLPIMSVSFQQLSPPGRRRAHLMDSS